MSGARSGGPSGTPASSSAPSKGLDCEGAKIALASGNASQIQAGCAHIATCIDCAKAQATAGHAPGDHPAEGDSAACPPKAPAEPNWTKWPRWAQKLAEQTGFITIPADKRDW